MKKFFLLSIFIMIFSIANSQTINYKSNFLKQTVKLDFKLKQLISEKGEEEKYQDIQAKELNIKLEQKVKNLPHGAQEYYFKATSNNKKALLLNATIELEFNRKNYTHFNGYQNMRKVKFDPNDVKLTYWFPTNAIFDKQSAIVLGINPMMLYSRIDSGLNKSEKGDKLFLQIPFVLDAGKSYDWSFVVSACKSRYGRSDIIQHWYDIFDKAYKPADKVNPSVISGESSYMYWKPGAYGYGFVGDFIRRLFGGRGSWEWCYKPFVRGGDWAITDEWSVGFQGHTKETLEKARQRTIERMKAAKFLDIAPMWYVNVTWAEWDLWKKNFKKIYPQDATPKKRRSWSQQCIYGIYSWGNKYGDLYLKGIDLISKNYKEPMGMGWDSCFAHQRFKDNVDGVTQTTRKSYVKGEIFALEGVGVSNLLDANHKNFNGKYRMANTVNLKLVSPYMIGVRTDAALYEGQPMRSPERLLRVESMISRLGVGKSIAWHKGAAPNDMKWIDWDDMEEDEAQEVYAQILENVLFLSYYWGGISAPGMPTIGVKFLFEATPELIDLVRLGRQSSPAVDAPEKLLVTCYGKGVGSRIVLINPDFKTQKSQIIFRPEYWDNKAVLVAREDGQDLNSTITKSGTVANIDIPARSIIILRVCGLTLLENNIKPVVVNGVKVNYQGRPPFWRLTLLADDGLDWNVELMREVKGARLRLINNGKANDLSKQEKPMISLNSNDWAEDVQADNKRKGVIELREYPLYDISSITISRIKDCDLIKAVKEGKLMIKIPENATKELKAEAERISEWFRFYTRSTGDEYFEPIISSKSLSGMKVISLTNPNEKVKLRKGQKGRARVIGDTINIAAKDFASLKQTVLAFLNFMDKVYPYYGKLPSGAGFDKLGLEGKTLKRPKNQEPYYPTLLELLHQTGVK